MGYYLLILLADQHPHRPPPQRPQPEPTCITDYRMMGVDRWHMTAKNIA